MRRHRHGNVGDNDVGDGVGGLALGTNETPRAKLAARTDAGPACGSAEPPQAKLHDATLMSVTPTLQQFFGTTLHWRVARDPQATATGRAGSIP
jgi:hypothetical protein